MDAAQGGYLGFVVLFAVAAVVMGGIEILLLIRTPDCERYKSYQKAADFGILSPCL